MLNPRKIKNQVGPPRRRYKMALRPITAAFASDLAECISALYISSALIHRKVGHHLYENACVSASETASTNVKSFYRVAYAPLDVVCDDEECYRRIKEMVYSDRQTHEYKEGACVYIGIFDFFICKFSNRWWLYNSSPIILGDSVPLLGISFKYVYLMDDGTRSLHRLLIKRACEVAKILNEDDPTYNKRRIIKQSI